MHCEQTLLLTCVEGFSKVLDEFTQTRNHLELLQDVTVNLVTPLEGIHQLLLDLRRSNVICMAISRRKRDAEAIEGYLG
jgi:hypothetical protein